MASVTVKPEILRWAIDRSGLPMEQLYKKFPKLDDWLTSKKPLSFRQLEEFARTTMTPFGVMFLNQLIVREKIDKTRSQNGRTGAILLVLANCGSAARYNGHRTYNQMKNHHHSSQSC